MEQVVFSFSVVNRTSTTRFVTNWVDVDVGNCRRSGSMQQAVGRTGQLDGKLYLDGNTEQRDDQDAMQPSCRRSGHSPGKDSHHGRPQDQPQGRHRRIESASRWSHLIKFEDCCRQRSQPGSQEWQGHKEGEVMATTRRTQTRTLRVPLKGGKSVPVRVRMTTTVTTNKIG